MRDRKIGFGTPQKPLTWNKQFGRATVTYRKSRVRAGLFQFDCVFEIGPLAAAHSFYNETEFAPDTVEEKFHDFVSAELAASERRIGGATVRGQ